MIAADGGVDRALALGLHVDVAIGDFDSVSAAGLAAAEAAGARIERHPAAKDATDLELALDAAIALAPARVLVIGAPAAGSTTCSARSCCSVTSATQVPTVDAYLGGIAAHVIRGSRTLTGRPGELLSLLPLHGPAAGVTTTGLEYPLRGETLPAGHEPRRLERLRRRGGAGHGRPRLPAGHPTRARAGGILVTRWHKVVGVLAVVDGRSRRRLRRLGRGESKEVVLVTHDSFAIPKDVKAAFEQESGLKLTILQGGDAGEMLNRALLTEGEPAGRRALRGRQQPALAGGRGRDCSSHTSRPGSTEVDGRYRLDPTSA